MYLKSIIINNFRPFFGESIFNLDFKDNNLNVIFGKNGCGKSTIIDAIYWCLYGKEISNWSNQPLCNYDAVDEVGVGDEIQVSVSCEFDDNGESINIQREKSFLKINEFNEIKSSYAPNIQFSYFSEDNVIFSHEDELIIKYFPINIFPFLLFGNEHIYLNNYSNLNIKEIFHKFNGQDILGRSIANLDKLSYDYSKKLKALGIHSEEYSRLLSMEERLLNKHDEIENSISKCHEEIIKLKDDSWEIELKLNKYPVFVEGNEVNIILKKHNKLLRKQECLTQKIIDISKRKEKLVVKLYPILVALSTVESGANDDELKDMLSKNTNIKNSRFLAGYFNIGNLFNSFKDIRYLKDQIEHTAALKQDLWQISRELEYLEKILESVDEPIFKQSISEREKIKRSIHSLEMELDKLKYDEKLLNKDLNKIRRDIIRYKEKGDSFSRTNQEYQFCLSAVEFGKLVKQQLDENVLFDFSKCINDYFIHEFKFEDKFKKIDVDDSFDISIIKKSNQKIGINDLSTNERKLFIIALIFSIHECLQLEYPIILMDPFVNLDDEKKNKLLSFILNKQESNQILLILNENQYDDNIKVNFLRNNVNEYSLINIDGNIEGASHD